MKKSRLNTHRKIEKKWGDETSLIPRGPATKIWELFFLFQLQGFLKGGEAKALGFCTVFLGERTFWVGKMTDC